MASTYFSLMAEFGSGTVRLETVCEKFFGLSPKEARRRAIYQKLPVPTFRGSESQKSPILIDISDLADHLDLMRKKAYEDYKSVRD